MSNESIEVSVLCLAYNHQKYIRSALEGFVRQKTRFKFEVIINDDASTDETTDIIKEYENKYPDIIKPVYQIENQYSKDIEIIEEILLPLVHGKYIAFCEGDDFWINENKLQIQYDLMEKESECSLCVHRVNCENDDGSLNSRTIPEKYYGIDRDVILTKVDLCKLYWVYGDYPFHTSSFFLRREIFDTKVILKRDVGILRKCLMVGNAIYINNPMSIRRLFTVGNFNSRLKDKGNQGVIQLLIQDIENDVAFDSYTNGEYQPYTLFGIYKRVMQISHYTPELSKKLLNKYDVKFFKWTTVIHGKERIKALLLYLMLRILPTKIYSKALTLSHNIRRGKT